MRMPRPQLVRPDAALGPSQEPEELGIEELFRLHAGAVASLGLSVLHSVEEADDLVQEVFLRAWRALDRLEAREEARPWLMTIAIRVARTRLRRRKLSRLLGVDAGLNKVSRVEPRFSQIGEQARLAGAVADLARDLKR